MYSRRYASSLAAAAFSIDTLSGPSRTACGVREGKRDLNNRARAHTNSYVGKSSFHFQVSSQGMRRLLVLPTYAEITSTCSPTRLHEFFRTCVCETLKNEEESHSRKNGGDARASERASECLALSVFFVVLMREDKTWLICSYRWEHAQNESYDQVS